MERGDYIPREKENRSCKEVFEKQRDTKKEPWRDRHGKEFTPGIHSGVGGNTKLYGAALLRLRERDFGDLRHAGGRSPAWDIRYQDLAHHNLEAERRYCVHGPPGLRRFADPVAAYQPEVEADDQPYFQAFVLVAARRLRIAGGTAEAAGEVPDESRDARQDKAAEQPDVRKDRRSVARGEVIA